MFREIRTSERITDRFEDDEAFRRIKPQNEMSIEEMNAFIAATLKAAHDEAVQKIDITKRIVVEG